MLAYELAVIVEHGMRRMLTEQNDEFYYVTVMNKNVSPAVAAQGSGKWVLIIY